MVRCVSAEVGGAGMSITDKKLTDPKQVNLKMLGI